MTNTERRPGESWKDWIARIAREDAAKAPKGTPEQLHRIAVLLGRRAA